MSILAAVAPSVHGSSREVHTGAGEVRGQCAAEVNTVDCDVDVNRVAAKTSTDAQQQSSLPPRLPAAALYRHDRRSDREAAVMLDAYASWQRGVLDGPPTASTRFLVFRPRRTGVGNVIEALLSSLLYAVLTHRVFLVSNMAKNGLLVLLS